MWVWVQDSPPPQAFPELTGVQHPLGTNLATRYPDSEKGVLWMTGMKKPTMATAHLPLCKPADVLRSRPFMVVTPPKPLVPQTLPTQPWALVLTAPTTFFHINAGPH